MVLEVMISKGKSDKLILRDGDDYMQVIDTFVKVNNLDERKKGKLVSSV